LAAADHLRQTQQLATPPDTDGRRQATLDAARTALGRPAFAAAWRTGRRIPLDTMVADAVAMSPGIGAAGTG
ncbi:MAG: hypothetical protein QOI74_3796, partial [Micromonosporaceae bacterium]|nr:hypothetical protein [Micromonosporaceae bacterium]